MLEVTATANQINGRPPNDGICVIGNVFLTKMGSRKVGIAKKSSELLTNFYSDAQHKCGISDFAYIVSLYLKSKQNDILGLCMHQSAETMTQH